jgi:hypothetical protein
MVMIWLLATVTIHHAAVGWQHMVWTPYHGVCKPVHMHIRCYHVDMNACLSVANWFKTM